MINRDDMLELTRRMTSARASVGPDRRVLF